MDTQGDQKNGLTDAVLAGRSDPATGQVSNVPVARAQELLPTLVQAVEDGQYIYLTRDGKRIAVLLPADIGEHYEEIEDKYFALRAQVTLMRGERTYSSEEVATLV